MHSVTESSRNDNSKSKDLQHYPITFNTEGIQQSGGRSKFSLCRIVAYMDLTKHRHLFLFIKDVTKRGFLRH